MKKSKLFYIYNGAIAILGVLMILYYLNFSTIVGYLKIVSLAWLAGGIYFVLKGSLLCFSKKAGILYDKLGKLKWIWRGLAAVAVAVFIVYEGVIIHSALSEPKADADYIIVLGARVVGTSPGRPLRERINEAFDYLEENPKTVAILSGGQGADEGISEARCMFNELTKMGIDPSRLIMEDESTSTYENMLFSLEHIEGDSPSVGIVTNKFHIHRSLKRFEEIAGYKGFGVPANDGEVEFIPYNYVREFFAFLSSIVGIYGD